MPSSPAETQIDWKKKYNELLLYNCENDLMTLNYRINLLQDPQLAIQYKPSGSVRGIVKLRDHSF
jgi:hypothetical protein